MERASVSAGVLTRPLPAVHQRCLSPPPRLASHPAPPHRGWARPPRVFRSSRLRSRPARPQGDPSLCVATGIQTRAQAATRRLYVSTRKRRTEQSVSVASASASSGTETSDIETGPLTRSSPLTSPASPSGADECPRPATSGDESPAPPEHEETSHPVSSAPANVPAPVTAQDLGGPPQAPARDDKPIVSHGYYAVSEDHDRASSDPSPERVVPHKGRRLEPSAIHPASGHERRSRLRSRHRRGDGAGRNSGARASSHDAGREPRCRSRRRQGDEPPCDSREGSPAREARQERTGLEVNSSDSDAPPRAKTPRLGRKAVTKGDTPADDSERIE
nr:mucin-1-like [Rhipicephalus microplus]